MQPFNAIFVGAFGGVLLALLYQVAASATGFAASDGLTTILFLVGWIASAALIFRG